MEFNVQFHPKAYKEGQELVKANPELIPKFREWLQLLAVDPYKFPKKYGKLKECRSINFGIKGRSGRLIFTVVDKNLVKILAIGWHDEAYNSAQRRV